MLLAGGELDVTAVLLQGKVTGLGALDVENEFEVLQVLRKGEERESIGCIRADGGVGETADGDRFLRGGLAIKGLGETAPACSIRNREVAGEGSRRRDKVHTREDRVGLGALQCHLDGRKGGLESKGNILTSVLFGDDGLVGVEIGGRDRGRLGGGEETVFRHVHGQVTGALVGRDRSGQRAGGTARAIRGRIDTVEGVGCGLIAPDQTVAGRRRNLRGARGAAAAHGGDFVVRIMLRVVVAIDGLVAVDADNVVFRPVDALDLVRYLAAVSGLGAGGGGGGETNRTVALDVVAGKPRLLASRQREGPCCCEQEEYGFSFHNHYRVLLFPIVIKILSREVVSFDFLAGGDDRGVVHDRAGKDRRVGQEG